MALLEVRSLPQDLSTEHTDQDTLTHVHTNTDTHIDVHTTSDTHLDANTDTHTDTHSNIDTLSCMQTDRHPNPHLSTFTNDTQPEMQPHTCQSSHNRPCLTDNATGPVHMLIHSQETEGVVFKAVGTQTNDDDEEDHRLTDPAGDTGNPDPEQKPVQKECSSSSAVIPICDRTLQALHLEESDRSLVDELDEEKGQGNPVCHRGSLSSLNSFSVFYNSTSLVKDILTGDEWAPYLSVNSNPSEFTSQSEVETQSLSVKDQPESIPVPPMTRSDHSEDKHSSTMGVPYYELVNQSDVSTLVDKKQDDAQEKVNNKWRSQDIIMIPKALLSSGVKLQKTPATMFRKEDIYDNIDLSCVKSHGLLDSSPQKHRIQLSKKRKSRRPLQKPTGEIYKIPRFGVFKLFAHPSVSSSSPPLSSSHSPPNGLSSSIFYPAPSTLSSHHFPPPNDKKRSHSMTGQDSTKYGCSSPNPLTRFVCNLKEKTKRKNTQ